MSDAWADFEQSNLATGPPSKKQPDAGQEKDERYELVGGCDWGQGTACDQDSRKECEVGPGEGPSKFIQIYEQYLQDKRSILQVTGNHKTYGSNPQKELRDWFENLDDPELTFKPQVEKIGSSEQYVCTLDLPVDEHDFTLTSGEHNCRKDAIDEACLDACRMLDDCGLLYSEQSLPHMSQAEDLARRKRVSEALKEDDIVFDITGDQKANKRQCTSETLPGVTTAGVNTYESLMARWRELNMSILMLKAKLVKLDLSVTKQAGDKTKKSQFASPSQGERDAPHELDAGDDDDEPDPLDEFMSTLETKTKLSIDDKIEKSRIKSQIASYEREQGECARLIEIAKPSSKTTG